VTPFLTRRRLALCLACLLVFAAAREGHARRQQGKNRTEEEIAALKKQVQALEEGQQQILHEISELKKLIEAKTLQPAGGTAAVATVNVKGEPFRGEAGARVAIIEYSDFECPFCGEYAREIYPQIVERYVKTGKVRYYFRDLPLPNHPNALLAAIGARCAGDQGKFWEMHDSLFANQSALSPKDLTDRAAALGLDQTRFSDCVSTAKYGAAIRKVASGAQRMGIDGTPAFAIGAIQGEGESVTINQVVLGADSFDDLKAILDEILTPSHSK